MLEYSQKLKAHPDFYVVDKSTTHFMHMTNRDISAMDPLPQLTMGAFWGCMHAVSTPNTSWCAYTLLQLAKKQIDV